MWKVACEGDCTVFFDRIKNYLTIFNEAKSRSRNRENKEKKEPKLNNFASAPMFLLPLYFQDIETV